MFKVKIGISFTKNECDFAIFFNLQKLLLLTEYDLFEIEIVPRITFIELVYRNINTKSMVIHLYETFWITYLKTIL